MTSLTNKKCNGKQLGKNYFRELDGLRAFAITLVIIEHFGGPLGSFYSGGYYGVDLFFIISGFLITSILLKSQDSSFWEAYRMFMGRRVLRIFPIYYLALFIFYAVDFASSRADIGWLVTYTWNYAAVWNKNELFYLWTLSVEEQYYLFWPLLVFALRYRTRTLFAITLLIVVIGYGQLLFDLFPTLTPSNYTGLFNRMGSLGLGSAGAIAVSRGWNLNVLSESLSIEIVTIGVLAWALTASSNCNVRLPFLGLCSLIIVLKAVIGEFKIRQIGAVLSSNIAVFIGRVSYGIYIIHWPLGIMLTIYVFDPVWLQIDFSNLGHLENLRRHSWIFKLPMVYVATVVVAYFSYRYFEKPFLNLKDRWFPIGQRVTVNS